MFLDDPVFISVFINRNTDKNCDSRPLAMTAVLLHVRIVPLNSPSMHGHDSSLDSELVRESSVRQYFRYRLDRMFDGVGIFGRDVGCETNLSTLRLDYRLLRGLCRTRQVNGKMGFSLVR